MDWVKKRMVFLIKFLGHASFQIKVEGKTIYVDPYAGEYTEKADIVLVTHSHRDHLDSDKLSKIRRKDTVVIAPEDCVSKIGGLVKVLKPGEKTNIGNIIVEATQAYNIKRFRSPGIPFHPKGLGIGYIITAKGKSIYHAGDGDFIPEMKRFGEEERVIDLVLLPSDGHFNMDPIEAAEAALAINPKIASPMHRRGSDPNIFKKEVESKSTINVLVLEAGQLFEI